ncbi:MAG: hypothetical protein C4532_11810 [Candidatus Abyssobacteria bacterium SURF_17]|uniref:Uncharacterized protein n=1 Tax=Candidatus Abyssobacteria bacterium SURF_17 TaxID=2093361 RepID=A0A419EWI4_9BACT|nr:MAG: hypothetical protein C4532_11810 [Candidatus Abyssubacteria bacterium SURF_17]
MAPAKKREFIAFKATRDFMLRLIALCTLQGEKLGRPISKSELVRIAVERFLEDELAAEEAVRQNPAQLWAESTRDGYKLLSRDQRDLFHYCVDRILEQERYLTAAKKYKALHAKFDRPLPEDRSNMEGLAVLLKSLIDEILDLDQEVRNEGGEDERE